ncbi:MAG: ABC transporter permease, partial [Bacillota bacterium]
AGSRIWSFEASLSASVVAVALLAATSLSGVGVALGMTLRSAKLTSVIVQVLFFLIMFLSPVLVPVSRLPLGLRTASVLLPSTHAAQALTLALAGQFDGSFWLSVAALIGFTLGSLVLVHWAVPWRLE